MNSKIKIHEIHTGNFKLDGGAMFGVVPKSIWSKLVPPNELNLCNWAMRCMLIEVGEKKILVDAGIGNKQSEKFYNYYDLNGDFSLQNSLSEQGFLFTDITDVILTHLHFDHCGGAVKLDESGELVPAFPNAMYHITKSQWNHAKLSNEREKPSFLLDNFIPLEQHNKINFVEDGQMLFDCIEIKVFNGHTLGMIAPIIHLADYTVMYMADLIPSSAHTPINYVIGYDIQPLVTMQEKRNLLPWLEENGVWLVYEHDAQFCRSQIEKNEKGQFKPKNLTNQWFDSLE